MSDRLQFQRAPGDQPVAPGQWVPNADPEGRASILAVLTCPDCGGVQCLVKERFKIATDGKVSPSIRCAYETMKPCHFHESGCVLVGWVQ